MKEIMDGGLYSINEVIFDSLLSAHSLSYRAFSLLSRVFPPFIRYHPAKSDKPDDREANDPVGVTSTSNCETYTIRLHPQRGLEIVGVGASAQVYKVDGEVVPKTSWVFERPGSSASDGDRWDYGSDTHPLSL